MSRVADVQPQSYDNSQRAALNRRQAAGREPDLGRPLPREREAGGAERLDPARRRAAAAAANGPDLGRPLPKVQDAGAAERLDPVRRRAAAATANGPELGRPLPKADSVSVSDRAHRAAAVATSNLASKLAPVPAELGTTDPDAEPAVKSFSPDDINALIESFGLKSGEDSFNIAFDLNGDGVIDSQDLNQALANATPAEPTQLEQVQGAFGLARGDEGFNQDLDLNKDGVIDSQDLNEALANI